MKLINGIARWLLVAAVLFFGLLVVVLAYVVNVCQTIMQHKGQAGGIPDSTSDSEPATLSSGDHQPVIRVQRVQFDAAHNRWLKVKGK